MGDCGLCCCCCFRCCCDGRRCGFRFNQFVETSASALSGLVSQEILRLLQSFLVNSSVIFRSYQPGCCIHSRILKSCHFSTSSCIFVPFQRTSGTTLQSTVLGGAVRKWQICWPSSTRLESSYCHRPTFRWLRENSHRMLSATKKGASVKATAKTCFWHSGTC